MAKESENPVTLRITLPLRYEADFNVGPYNAVKSSFQISQAVVPFILDDDWALITRTKLPIYWQPPKKRQSIPLFKQPVNISLASYYNAIRPAANKETWLVQLTVTFIFAK